MCLVTNMERPAKQKRAGNITQQQKDVLVDFLQVHKELQTGKFSQTFTKAKGQELWQQVTQVLNSIGGAKKEWHQWRKTWHDLRSNAKTKKSAALKHRKGTGGGSPLQETLTITEEAIVTMLGPTAIEGDSRVREPSVAFDYASTPEYITLEVEDTHDGENSGVWEANPESTNLARNTTKDMQANPVRILDERAQNSGSQSGRTNAVHVPDQTQTARTPSKRIQRLHNTMTATDRLANQNDKQLELMSKYYARKLELYEEDVQVKKEISLSLQMICQHLAANQH